MTRVLFILFLSLCSWQAMSQEAYPVHALDSLMVQEARPMIIFIRAPWCRYCEVMEQTTFKDEHLMARMEEEYYLATLNGEGTEEVVFAGQTFSPGPNQTHELALELGSVNGKITYPTVVIMNAAHEVVFQHTGMMTAPEMLQVLDQME